MAKQDGGYDGPAPKVPESEEPVEHDAQEPQDAPQPADNPASPDVPEAAEDLDVDEPDADEPQQETPGVPQDEEPATLAVDPVEDRIGDAPSVGDPPPDEPSFVEVATPEDFQPPTDAIEVSDNTPEVLDVADVTGDDNAPDELQTPDDVRPDALSVAEPDEGSVSALGVSKPQDFQDGGLDVIANPLQDASSQPLGLAAGDSEDIPVVEPAVPANNPIADMSNPAYSDDNQPQLAANYSDDFEAPLEPKTPEDFDPGEFGPKDFEPVESSAETGDWNVEPINAEDDFAGPSVADSSEQPSNDEPIHVAPPDSQGWSGADVDTGDPFGSTDGFVGVNQPQDGDTQPIGLDDPDDLGIGPVDGLPASNGPVQRPDVDTQEKPLETPADPSADPTALMTQMLAQMLNMNKLLEDIRDRMDDEDD